MTRIEAFAAMQNGGKITHDYFTDNEWYEIKNGKIMAEDGVIHSGVFWNKDFMKDGWHLFIEKTKAL